MPGTKRKFITSFDDAAEQWREQNAHCKRAKDAAEIVLHREITLAPEDADTILKAAAKAAGLSASFAASVKMLEGNDKNPTVAGTRIDPRIRVIGNAHLDDCHAVKDNLSFRDQAHIMSTIGSGRY